MSIFANEQRQAFVRYLRTGQRSRAKSPDVVEVKFNPYHDPRNGRFTFAPGGGRSLANVIVSDRRNRRLSPPLSAPVTEDSENGRSAQNSGASLINAIYRPGETVATLRPAMARSGGSSNLRPFIVPMTLQQVFPGLQSPVVAPILAPIQGFFAIQGPARDLTTELTREWSNTLINQIKAIDPNYRFESLGFPQTQAGQISQINDLRLDRAAAYFRTKQEIRPLQVETLRFLQERTDIAYARGVTLLRAGKLKIRLSEQEALGNYIDRHVRNELRQRYNVYGLDGGGQGIVRVNRREDNSSGTELTYRRPDARVGNVAFDVTLTAKTLKTPQVRGFFDADFRPDHVVIIRPSMIGRHHTYLIPRQEQKQ